MMLGPSRQPRPYNTQSNFHLNGVHRTSHRAPLIKSHVVPLYDMIYGDMIRHSEEVPRFFTKASNISVLQRPDEFYNTLCALVKQSKREIFLATLYLGTGPLEQRLVECVQDQLETEQDLHVHFLFDYFRGTRNLHHSSVSIVRSLAEKFPDRVHIRLFQSPLTASQNILHRILPNRIMETCGVQHTKLYTFDDTTLVSGANLSQDYFTNRQDRYMIIRDANLTGFVRKLSHILSSGSYEVDTDLNIAWPDSNITPAAPTQDVAAYKSAMHRQISAHILESKRAMNGALSEETLSQLTQKAPKADTMIQPLIQMAPFGLNQEVELGVPMIMRAANTLATIPGGEMHTRIDWTSGYFALHDSYKKMLLESKANVYIVTASPQANGFYGARGFTGKIPHMYTHMAATFYDEMRKQQRILVGTGPDFRPSKRRRHITFVISASPGLKQTHSVVELAEWERQGWTYHAKGIWLTPPSRSIGPRGPTLPTISRLHHTADEALYISQRRTPIMTMIGSSNYGLRSAHRDIEMNALITTLNPYLRRQLDDELRNLRAHTTVVSQKTFNDISRKVPMVARMGLKLFKTRL